MKKQQWLSQEAIDEFKKAYEEEFGEVLTDDEAEIIATRVLKFFDILVHEKQE